MLPVREERSIYRTRDTTVFFARQDIVGEREELQKELDLVRKHSSISLKRSRDPGICIYRECVQERGFRVGRRERGAGKCEARCKHKLALDLHTKGASNK
jgi:hypothetical protein